MFLQSILSFKFYDKKIRMNGKILLHIPNPKGELPKNMGLYGESTIYDYTQFIIDTKMRALDQKDVNQIWQMINRGSTAVFLANEANNIDNGVDQIGLLYPRKSLVIEKIKKTDYIKSSNNRFMGH